MRYHSSVRPDKCKTAALTVDGAGAILPRKGAVVTSKQRLAAAMSGGRPDRVPVMCQMSIGHMLRETGASPSRFWHSTEDFAAGLLALRARYRFDGILVSLHGHAPDWEGRAVSTVRGPEGERVRWKNGDETWFPADDLPLFHPASPLDYVLDLFGFEQAMLGFLDDPGRAAAVLDRFTEGIVGIAEGLAATGVDAIKISSPFAGAGFLSTAFYRTFVLPYEGRIARAIEARNVRAYIHTCGDIHDRLELLAEGGASGIECLDPPPLGRVDLEDAKRRVGGRIFIKGNIDPVNVLLAGDRSSVRADARRRVETGRPGGRFILSTACSIAPHTPRDNVAVLAEVAEEHGRY